MNYRSYNDTITLIKENLCQLRDFDLDLIVGIPRSGMLAAYIIGLELNLDVTDLSNFTANGTLLHGNTRASRNSLSSVSEAKNILLVDDSIRSGNSMKRAREKINVTEEQNIFTLVVYSEHNTHQGVDVIFECVPTPRVFEWHLFHHSIIQSTAFDMDGVLCEDPAYWQNDDGKTYKDFLRGAKPKYLPTGTINSIVTNRLERYRTETEEWLKKHGVMYSSLKMLDLASKEERQNQSNYTAHKSNYYRENDSLKLFIESDNIQALQISKSSGKPVFCVETNQMIMPDTMSKLNASPAYHLSGMKYKIIRRLPSSIVFLLVNIKSKMKKILTKLSTKDYR